MAVPLPSLRIALALVVATALPAWSMCNIIPPAEQAFPSTLGSVTSPVTLAGDEVEIRLTGCDGVTGFDPTPANNTVAIRFLPDGGGQPAPTLVPSGTITVADCAGFPNPPCNTLRFPMPATPGLAGPAAIAVTVGATVAADIGPLFQPHKVGGTCDKFPESVFQIFTVLPPANLFGSLAGGSGDAVLTTLDGSGSLLVPFDYRQVLPLGPGAPIARLLSGSTTLDAFTASPGQPIDVPSSYVRSFTSDGRPLPPLLRATDAGNQIFGATDGAVGFVRIARDGPDGVKFDLQDRRTSGGYGPIVIPSSQYTVGTNVAVPLANLRSTATGVSFAREESLEGNLNAASGDNDTADRVVQLIDVGAFVTTNTGMAASPTHSPLVGGAALDVGPTIAAFLESEVAQNASDLNGDGDALDDVLRVFTVGGTQLTPSATLVGDRFPGVNRKPVAVDGALVYYREPRPGLYASGSFGGGNDLVASPDGRYLYEVAPTFGGRLNAYRLDPQTGVALIDGGHVTNTSGNLDGATGIDISADGRFIFVAAKAIDQLECVEVRYDAEAGANLYHNDFFPPPIGGGGRLNQGEGGVDGLTGISDVAASPDGAFVYAVADGDDAVTTAAVDPAHGALTFVGTLKNGVDVADMADPVRVAASSDGGNVYVAANGSSAIVVFTRNPTTGVLTPLESLLDGAAGGPALGGITDGDGAISIFSRNPATGALTFVSVIQNGVGGVTTLNQAMAVLVSPDGGSVYATSAFGALLVFTRQMPGGGLTFVESHGGNFGVPLGSSRLAIAPDGQRVYQEYDFGAPISVYSRAGTLRAFDTQATALRPGLGTANDASVVAVGGGRAAFTTAGGDGPVQLYDAATDTLTDVGGGDAARKLALSAHLLAMLVPEHAVGKDANKDGDLSDDVVVLASPADPTAAPKVLPIQADDIAVTDLCRDGAADGKPCTTDADCPDGTCRGIAVIAANEWRYKDNGEEPHPPEADFNDNGAVEDVLVLFTYDTATKKLVNLGWQAYDFIVSGHLVAFRTNEHQRRNEDLNGDDAHEGDFGGEDDQDTVMMIYDVATGTIINPWAAVAKCEIPGCDPGLPYKIKGETVVFLVPENVFAQQRDMDGDGLLTHTVIVNYDTRNAVTQVLGRSDLTGTFLSPTTTTAPPPMMPTTFADGAIVYRQVLESDIGKDVNEDLDFDDVVTIVDGDSDGDGIYDSADVCAETLDPDQRDSDADSLPDACDPNPYCAVLAPAAPPTPPADALACQKTFGKAARQLIAATEKATRGCLDQIAKGTLVGNASKLCRGGISNADTRIPPADAKTAARIDKALSKASTVIAKGCPEDALTALATCEGCLASTATAGVAVVTAASYGNPGAITPDVTLGCQRAIGKLAAKHLATVTKARIDCLTKLHAGALVGSADTLCLGAGTASGVTAPTDLATAGKLQKAADVLAAGLAKACPGSLAATLDACGDDPVSLAGCLQCANGRQALVTVQAAYGPQ